MDFVRVQPKRTNATWIGAAVGALVIASVTAALATLRDAPPPVERSALWIDQVAAGEFVREVSGPGILAPESLRLLSAPTGGRVERLPLSPGAAVGRDDVILELVNPEVEQLVLEAKRDVGAAETSLADLKAELRIAHLEQKGVVARVASERAEAVRRADVSRQLSEKGLIGALELQRDLDRLKELQNRFRYEQEHLVVLDESSDVRITAAEAKLGRVQELLGFRERQFDELTVRAGLDGVLQEVLVEIGQEVAPGTRLAKVVQVGRLKAEIRVPESQAKEVDVGQPAQVDTRGSVISGRVSRIDPVVKEGTVTIEVSLTEELPAGARPRQSVQGVIETQRLDRAVFVGRPAFGRAGGRIQLFVLEPDGEHAQRRTVELGATSAQSVEVRSGLRPGERVILSDMSEWDGVDRVRLD